MEQEQLDKNNLPDREKLKDRLLKAEKEFTEKYNELVKLCSKYGMYIETTMAHYDNLN